MNLWNLWNNFFFNLNGCVAASPSEKEDDPLAGVL